MQETKACKASTLRYHSYCPEIPDHSVHIGLQPGSRMGDRITAVSRRSLLEPGIRAVQPAAPRGCFGQSTLLPCTTRQLSESGHSPYLASSTLYLDKSVMRPLYRDRRKCQQASAGFSLFHKDRRRFSCTIALDSCAVTSRRLLRSRTERPWADPSRPRSCGRAWR